MDPAADAPTTVIDQASGVNVSERCSPGSAEATGLSGKEQSKKSQHLDPTTTFLTGVALVENATTVGDTVCVGGAATKAPAICCEGPRYTDSRNLVNEIITTMDLPRMSFLRKEIQKKPGFNRIDFIVAMATCVAGDISDPVDCIDDVDVNMIANFCEIFAQVDINNNGMVDWEELTTFMIEMGMKGWTKSERMPSYAYVGQIDSAKPTQAADQIQYFPENDTVAIIEDNAKFFRVYHADSMHLKRQYDVEDAVSVARSLCYCNTGGHYVLGTSSSRVRFYEESSGSVWKDYEAPSLPICISYAETHDLVVAGDMIGNLFSWKVAEVGAANTDDGDVPPHHVLGPPLKTKRTPGVPEKDRASRMGGGHVDAVLSLLTLTGTDMVASCSMDHTVKLWDLTTLAHRKTLLGHLKGVKHMTYCPDHRLIVSGGFSYEIVINNTYHGSPISRLRGHSSSIIGVEHVTGTSQLITADTEGFCKLWDLRTFSCVDTFSSSLDKNRMAGKNFRNNIRSPATWEPKITCMTVSPLSKRVFVGGRTVDSFEVLRDECEDLTDDSAVLAVCFNANNLTFVTASASALKVWDGATGELVCADVRQQQSHQKAAAVEGDTSKGELSSMCLGARGSTIVAGDELGHIKVYNYFSNTELKSYNYPECKGKAHGGNVRALIFVDEQNLIISASGDRSISIHDESKDDTGVLLRRITNASWSEITALRYSSHLGLIASGNTDGSIQLWNFERGRHEGCCEELHQGPVTCLAFLDPFPILLSTDAAGYLALWAVPPARVGLRFKRIFTWINKQPVSDRMYGGGGQADGQVPIAVTALECQVEMISTSIAASTVTDSVALSVNDSDASGETSLEMSDEEEGGDDDDIDPNIDNANDRDASARCPPTGAPSRDKSATGQIENDGAEVTRNQHGAHSSLVATPPENANGTAAEMGGVLHVAESGGDRGGTGFLPHEDNTSLSLESSSYPVHSGGASSSDRSFREHLAATLRKYQGERKRHPEKAARTSRGSQEQQRVFWNIEMLSYTVYTADEVGTVTTWDLKPVLLGLTRTYGGHDWDGHGVGVVRSPAVYSSAFLFARQDAKNALLEQRYRLEARASMGWIPDRDIFGLHRIGYWEAHLEPIISMSLVDDPPTVLTSAMDRLVKLWSPAGDLQGVLRQEQDPDSPWTFRVNRGAQEDRKMRAAENVILETKASLNNCSTAAGMANKENPAQLPPTSHRCRKGPNISTTAATAAFGSAPGNNKIASLRLEKERNARSDDREGSENSRRREDSGDGGDIAGDAGGHKLLVDVSRRPARAPRKYAEEELDRYCESSISSTATKMGPLRFASNSLLAVGSGCGGDSDTSGRSARRTPRRVPVRPKTSGKGVTTGRVLGRGFAPRSGSASPRALRGQLSVSRSLSAR